MDAMSNKQLEQYMRKCELIGVAAMKEVQAISGNDEAEFQAGLLVVIKQLHDHLGLSIAAMLTKRDFMRELGRG